MIRLREPPGARWPSLSVRARTTAAVSAVVVVLLAVLCVVLVAVVERSVVLESERLVDAGLAELGGVHPVDEELFRHETDSGIVLVGLVTEDDSVLGPLADPATGEVVGELVLDPDTHEVLEAYVDDRPVPVDSLPPEVVAYTRTLPPVYGDDVVIADTALGGARHSLRALAQSLLVVVPALGVALVAAVWWQVGRALRPMVEITDRARRIGPGTAGARVPEPGTRDEVGQLARVVNDMLERIETGVARERRFVADVSHELRTPLATMRVAAELEAGRERGAAAAVLTELDRMEALVDDLLMLARLDAGSSPRAAPEEVDLGGLVEDVVARCPGPRAAVTRSPGRHPVVGHPGLLARLLANLLENAARHARERIDVSVTSDRGHVVVAVDDDGPGIPRHERERVFQRFVRLDPSRSGDGHGLGLAIARSIAEHHSGALRAGDAPLGGARIILSLPAPVA